MLMTIKGGTNQDRMDSGLLYLALERIFVILFFLDWFETNAAGGTGGAGGSF